MKGEFEVEEKAGEREAERDFFLGGGGHAATTAPLNLDLRNGPKNSKKSSSSNEPRRGRDGPFPGDDALQEAQGDGDGAAAGAAAVDAPPP